MRGRGLLGVLAVLVVAAAIVAYELRRRAMHVDPPPPRGATRVTVIARGVVHGSPVLLDPESVWFTRGEAEDASLLAVPKNGGAARVIVSHAHTVVLAGIDETYVYYFTRAPAAWPNVDPQPALRRVPRSGGLPAAVGEPCGHSRIAWADATGLYCLRYEQSLPALVRVDPSTGSVRWSARLGDGEWTFARGGGCLYATVLQRHWTCGATLFQIDVDSGQAKQLADGGQCPAPLAADESGAYAGVAGEVESGGGPTRYDVTRYPPSRLASPVLVARAPAGSLAVTRYHVLWRDLTTHEVVMVAKGGEERAVLATRALGDLAADDSAVYFTSEDDTLVRVDGLD
jgi:hypothetical protein